MKNLVKNPISIQSLESFHKYTGEIKIIFMLMFSLFTLISCSDDNDDDPKCIEETRVEDATSVDAPDSGVVNETIDIEVEFTVSNSCGEFNQFLESGTDNSRIIEIEAIYEGCACSQVIETITATYQFEADEPGNYELNFQSDDPEFISVNLTITEPEEEEEE